MRVVVEIPFRYLYIDVHRGAVNLNTIHSLVSRVVSWFPRYTGPYRVRFPRRTTAAER